MQNLNEIKIDICIQRAHFPFSLATTPEQQENSTRRNVWPFEVIFITPSIGCLFKRHINQYWSVNNWSQELHRGAVSALNGRRVCPIHILLSTMPPSLRSNKGSLFASLTVDWCSYSLLLEKPIPNCLAYSFNVLCDLYFWNLYTGRKS